MFSQKQRHNNWIISSEPAPQIILLGSILGFIAGAIGIGGGIYLVPLIIIFGLGSEKEAAAAGATFICVNSLVGFIARFKSGNFDPDFILPLIVLSNIKKNYFDCFFYNKL